MNQDSIIETYASGASIHATAEKFGIGFGSVQRLLKARGFQTRPCWKPKARPLDVQHICVAYAAGKSMAQIGREVGDYPAEVGRILHRHGGSVRPRIHRRFHCDDEAFRVIDTEAKAYWLGFLAADGYPGAGKGRALVLALSSRDRSHLGAFKDFLGSKANLHEYMNYSKGIGHQRVSCVVSSSILVADLARYGVVANRGEGFRFPEISDELKRHFLRGYFDGDGWFCQDKNPVGTYVRTTWGLVAGRALLEDCKEFIDKFSGCSGGKIRASSSSTKVCALEYKRKREVPAIARLMYLGATIFLHRKFAIARPLLEASGLVTGAAI